MKTDVPGPMPAKVTIIIPAYNAQQTIARAIASALAQTEHVEVIVVDDASTDQTVDLVTAIANDNQSVQVLRQATNQGPASARNAAINASAAPWIALLDADDFMAPNRVEALLEIATTTNWDFIADDIFKVDEHALDGPKARLWSDAHIGVLALSFETFVDANRSGERGERRELGFIKPLMSREFLNQNDLRYDTKMRLGEDYDLYARALAVGARFCLVDPKGYTAVVRAGSLSGRHAAKDLAALYEADRRLLDHDRLTPSQKSVVRRHMISTHKEWAWLRLIDAVKARDLAKAVTCFNAPMPVVAKLLFNLAEQVVIRSKNAALFILVRPKVEPEQKGH